MGHPWRFRNNDFCFVDDLWRHDSSGNPALNELGGNCLVGLVKGNTCGALNSTKSEWPVGDKKH